MNPRVCAHPAGCELPTAHGDIYCEGCGTDPTLAQDDGERDDVLTLAPDTPNDHGDGSYYFYDERD